MLGQDDAIAAARKLWGPENPKLSSKVELRFGTNGSKSLKLNGDQTVWYDHEEMQGGGIVDLCKLAGVTNGQGGEPIITYAYDDEDDNLLFEVVRYPGHKFLQRRPDGHGGWVWKLDGTRRVLYHLPVLVRSTETVFVVEGEKDADNLAALGFISTTNPGGAGKWRPEYSEVLRGREVVIIPDKDPPGIDHAAQVLASLTSVAKSVIVLTLSHGKDVSEWLANGGTKEQLLALVRETPASPPPTPKTPSIVSYTMAELEGKTFMPLRWIVNRYIPEGLTLLAGKPKSGKSWLMLATALSRSEGLPILGETCPQGDVLYCALEDNERRMNQRADILVPSGWPPNMHVTHKINDNDHGGIAQLQEWVDAHPSVKLIIIDTLANFRGKKDKNEDQYQCDYRTMKALLDFGQKNAVDIIVIHHVRKQTAEDVFDTISGTLGLSAVADTLVVLTRTKANELRLVTRGRDVEPEDKMLDFDPDTAEFTILGDYEIEDDGISKTDSLIQSSLGSEASPMTPSQVAKMTGIKEATVRQALRRMAKKGQIKRAGYGEYHA